MEYALPIIQQIAIMFLLIILGFILFKIKVITTEGRKQLSEIILTIVSPALVFMVYQDEFKPELLGGILWSFALAVLSISVGILFSKLTVSKKDADYKIGQFAVIYTNCGYMGIPLIQGVFGSEGVMYVASYLTVFNLFVWSHGIMHMSGKGGFSSLLKVIKNPTIIAVALGLICFATGFRIHHIPATTLNYIKELNTPLAMLVAGATMAQSDLLGALKKKAVMIPVLLKLVIFPLLVIALFKLLPIPNEMVFTVSVIAAACPTATITTLYALRYGRNACMASEIFAISTFLCGISLPIVTVLSSFVYNL